MIIKGGSAAQRRAISDTLAKFQAFVPRTGVVSVRLEDMSVDRSGRHVTSPGPRSKNPAGYAPLGGDYVGLSTRLDPIVIGRVLSHELGHQFMHHGEDQKAIRAAVEHACEIDVSIMSPDEKRSFAYFVQSPEEAGAEAISYALLPPREGEDGEFIEVFPSLMKLARQWTGAGMAMDEEMYGEEIDGWERMGLEPRRRYNLVPPKDAEDGFDPNEPRDNTGKWTSGGGGSGKRGGAEITGTEFVSPNENDNKHIREAIHNIGSEKIENLVKASKDIDKFFNVREQSIDKGVGAWADGAEETTIQRLDPSVDYETGAVVTAAKGLIAHQKAVLWFEPGNGKNVLYEFEAPEADMEKLHTTLLKDGVQFHTLVPGKDKTTVYVYDENGGELEHVKTAAGNLGVSNVKRRMGRGEFIGSWDSREDGAKAYQERIEKWIGSDRNRREGWRRLLDRWRYPEAKGGTATVEMTKIAADDAGGFDPTKHPRVPAGSAKGGQFTSVHEAATGHGFEEQKKEDGSPLDETVKLYKHPNGASLTVNEYGLKDDPTKEPQWSFAKPGSNGYKDGTYQSGRGHEALHEFLTKFEAEQQYKADQEAGKTPIHPELLKVGGDEWNQKTAERLAIEQAKVKPELDKIVEEGLGESVDLPGKEDDDEENTSYVPESWDEMSGDQQEEAKHHWMESSFSDFKQSEEESWLDSEQPDEIATRNVAQEFNNGNDTEWAIDALKEFREGWDEDGGKHIPFDDDDLINALEMDEDDGTFSFNDKLLDASQPDTRDPKQQDLPGFTIAPAHELLDDDTREAILEALNDAKEKRITKVKDDLDPSDYVDDDMVKDYMEEYWDGSMSDNEKFKYAQNNTLEAQESESEPEETARELELPKQWDPLNEDSDTDYRRTQAMAHYIFQKRAEQLFEARGIDAKSYSITSADSRLWSDWKSSSTTDAGMMLQAAIADELGGRFTNKHFPDKASIDDLKARADSKFENIGGYAGLRTMVRAKWETTQYMLDKAGIHDLELYRGIGWKGGGLDKITKENGYTALPLLNIDRNGASSWTNDVGVANGFGGGYGGTHVTLRARVPRTSIVSVPAYGQNIHSEHELIVAGTAFKGWDVWKGNAPTFSEVPCCDRDAKGVAISLPKKRSAAEAAEGYKYVDPSHFKNDKGVEKTFNAAHALGFHVIGPQYDNGVVPMADKNNVILNVKPDGAWEIKHAPGETNNFSASNSDILDEVVAGTGPKNLHDALGIKTKQETDKNQAKHDPIGFVGPTGYKYVNPDHFKNDMGKTLNAANAIGFGYYSSYANGKVLKDSDGYKLDIGDDGGWQLLSPSGHQLYAGMDYHSLEGLITGGDVAPPKLHDVLGIPLYGLAGMGKTATTTVVPKPQNVAPENEEGKVGVLAAKNGFTGGGGDNLTGWDYEHSITGAKLHVEPNGSWLLNIPGKGKSQGDTAVELGNAIQAYLKPVEQAEKDKFDPDIAWAHAQKHGFKYQGSFGGKDQFKHADGSSLDIYPNGTWALKNASGAITSGNAVEMPNLLSAYGPDDESKTATTTVEPKSTGSIGATLGALKHAKAAGFKESESINNGDAIIYKHKDGASLKIEAGGAWKLQLPGLAPYVGDSPEVLHSILQDTHYITKQAA